MTVCSIGEADESTEYSFERYTYFISTKPTLCDDFTASNCYLMQKRGTVFMNELGCCEPLWGL
jgi:hypothetical protein